MFDTNEIDWSIVLLIIVAVVLAAIVLMAMKKKTGGVVGRGETPTQGDDEHFVVGLGDDYEAEMLDDGREAPPAHIIDEMAAAASTHNI